jgi:hypothetical protein
MYLTIDFGGTNTRLGVYKNFDPKSRGLYKILPTQNNYPLEKYRIKEELIKSNFLNKIQSAGISFNGYVDEERAQIIKAANLDSWDGINLQDLFTEEFGIKNVEVCNDVKAAALSEVYSREFNIDDFIFIIWSTGIGACRVSKSAKKSLNFQQIELGRQVINKTIEVGKKIYPGYLSGFCGGKRLPLRYNKNISKFTDRDWEDVLEDMSDGIYNLMLLNPSSNLIFGGGIALHQASRLKVLKNKVLSKMPIKQSINFDFANFKEDSCLIGALFLIKYKVSTTLPSPPQKP